jgi:hypothetical protein
MVGRQSLHSATESNPLSPYQRERALPRQIRECEPMRCSCLREGHIAAVELLDVKSDEEAVEKCRVPFEERKSKLEGFEVLGSRAQNRSWSTSRRRRACGRLANLRVAGPGYIGDRPRPTLASAASVWGGAQTKRPSGRLGGRPAVPAISQATFRLSADDLPVLRSATMS